MKVLQINAYGNFSTGTICQNIATECEKRGIQTLFLFGRNSCNRPINHYKVSSFFNCAVHYGFSRLFDCVGSFSFFDTKRMVKKIREFSPDIIHLHLIHGYYCNLKVLFNYLRNFGGKIVWTFHDCWAYTGHCSYYSAEKCRAWMQTDCKHCKHKMNYPRSLLFSRSSVNYRNKKRLFTSLGTSKMTIVANSNWLKEEIGKSFFSNYNVQTIHNGVDQDLFCPTPLNIRKMHNIPDSKTILLGVANKWDPRKGLNDFIRLSSLLPENKYAFIIVGMTPKEEKLYDIPKSFIVINRTSDQKELAGYYSNCDYFLDFTYEDTFPTTHLEAISCGCPVLTYDTGGCAESILNEECGKVFPTGAIEDVASFLESGPTFDRAICKRSSVVFARERTFASYIDLYNSVYESK